jgi:flagellar hook-associated protein 3 FlgL
MIMTMVSFGDLAQSYLLKTQTSKFKSETGRITLELSSGRLADVAKSLSGDMGRLSALTRSHDLAKGYLTAAQEGAFRASAMQRVISKISDGAQTLASQLLSSPQNESQTTLTFQARLGADQLEAALSALNTSTSGRSLFSGVATNKAAVVSANTILTELRADISRLRTDIGRAPTPDEVMGRISTWFDTPTTTTPPSIFGPTYSGGQPTDDMAVSPDDTAWLGLTANDPAFRETLKGFAATALINDPGIFLLPSEGRAFARLAGERMLAGNDALIAVSASLGVSEARIETAISRNSAEMLTLEMATADLVQSDPFSLATELEAVQTNLETLYAITARISRLSLTDFMR